ncbi:MAG TPA: PBP1A family penicillin-binding protein [Anaeromyxobacter sp.]|nr:PBP1A family penicillin-binding protein [Anaeromyxobacter sp.]
MPRRSRRRLGWILRLAILVVVLPPLTGGAMLFAWTRELPAFDTLKDYQPLVSSHVFAADGSEVFQFFRERRTVVPFAEIPEVLKKAVLAAEDAKFYQHEGINYLAIARCLGRGVLRGGVACGGSTITQQVVKTFLLSTDSRVKRKVKELVLAPRLEQNLKKDEILYLYLNQIYLGHLRYGVEEASRFYFGKGVRDLKLGEAALLAGVIQSPMRLSPVNHPVAAKKRQQYVLRRMREEGWISEAQLKAEIDRPLPPRPAQIDPGGSWYADAVRKLLEERYGEERLETDGLEIRVAMNPRLQRYAELALEADLRAVDRRQGWRGPLFHLEPSQRQAALPLWRRQLEGVEPGPGEVLVWDLGRVDPELIEPGERAEKDVARMARARPLEAGGIYAGLVVKVEEKSATVDLGNASGELSLSDVAWARRWNPLEATAAPRKMSSVLAEGDVVRVQVLPGKLPPERAAREKRPLPLSLEQLPQVEGALVAIDPETRGVQALVGGLDYGAQNLFNRALQAHRQPGSAMKPFVWGAALESRRFTPATVVYDTPDLYRDPWTGKEWKPHNFERDEFDGAMLLSAALAQSKNTVSVKLVNSLGVDAVIGFAHRLGIESELPRNLTLALGTGELTPVELTNAYATIAAQGFAAPPVLVVSVRDRHGQVLEDHPAPAPSSAVPASASPPGESPAAAETATEPAAADALPAFPLPASGTRPDVACVLTWMMRQVIESGTASSARVLARPAAGKTGTTQDHRDAWFVGFTPGLVAGVWVGFDDHSPLGPRETGAVAALPAWISFMQAAMGDRPAADFDLVPGVEQVRIDAASGKLAGPAEPGAPFVPFLSGTAPTEAGTREAAPQNFFMDDP